MMDRYIDILKNCGADAWEITDTRTKSWEFYYIRHRLDQNRAKDVEHISFKVYKYSEDGQSLGIASGAVAPTASDEEVRRVAEDLVYEASLVSNKPYELNKPQDAEPLEADERPLEEEAESYICTMQDIAETENEFLNSFEIFVNQNVSRFITSEGIDITEKYPTSMLDIVVNAKNKEKEIELYRIYSLGACQSAQLKEDIEELLRFGKDRLDTVPTPNLGKSAIVLSTDAALEVYRYFLDNMNAAFVVRGMSSLEIGKPISETYIGDKITLKALRFLAGSPSNFSYDEEGAPVKDMTLIKDGVPVAYTGSRMFSQYLGIDDSFNVTNWSIEGGSRTKGELRTGSFLEIVEFSDFQVDSVTGDIFGEIRLAYYHDGSGNVTRVSGGSVSGSMLDNIACLGMSKEVRSYANASIPCVTRLENVTIAGVKKD